MQAKCRMKPSYPNGPQGSGATSAATTSWSKPRPASRRAVSGVAPRRSTSPAARSRSGSSVASAASTSADPTPARSSSKRIATSPFPRSARTRARSSAKRPSSTRPTCCNSSTTAWASSAVTPARRKRSSRLRCECSRLARARVAIASASVREPSASTYAFEATFASGAASVSSTCSASSGAGLPFGSGSPASGSRRPGNTWAGPTERREPQQHLLRHVRMLPQERGRVLPALSEPLLLEAEVRARLLHDLALDRRVEDRPFPGDPGPVDDVELGLLERGRDLVLHHLHAHAVAVGFDAVLQRLDSADVEPDRGVELQRPPARRRLRIAEHDADLLAQLVCEQADRVGAVERARQLAQGLTHQPCLQADVGVAHLALDLGLRRQRRDRVDRDHIERTGADQQLGDLERLLAGIRLRDEQIVDVDPDPLGVRGVHRVLGVDEGADPAAALGLGDHVVDKRGLARRLRAEDLDDAAARQPADPEREVERQRAGRDRPDRDLGAVVHAHHRALAELALDLAERGVESLLAVHSYLPPTSTDSRTS